MVQGSHQGSRGYLCTAWLVLGKEVLGQHDLQTYNLEVWHWRFSGVFSRQHSELVLRINTKDFPDMNIDDMDTRPPEYVNQLTKEILWRRGDWF